MEPEGAVLTAPVWRAVTPEHPCPCCGGDAECRVAHLAGFVQCFGCESSRPLEAGGFLHLLGVDGCNDV